MRSPGRLSLRTPPIGAGALVILGALVAGPVLAASLSTSSMSLAVGGTANRSVSSVVVSSRVPAPIVTSSNTAVATVVYTPSSSRAGTITVTGVSAGSATISFQDAKGTYRFTANVRAPMVVTSMPSPLAIDVGKAASFLLSGTSSTNITVYPTSTSYFTAEVLDSKTVVVFGRAVGTASITISDGFTRATVPVTVTTGLLPTSAGRLMAGNCYQCHGTNGTGGFEAFADDSVQEIYKELREFASKTTSTNNIMAAHVAGYTDLQLQNIAAAIYAANHP